MYDVILYDSSILVEQRDLTTGAVLLQKLYSVGTDIPVGGFLIASDVSLSLYLAYFDNSGAN